MPALKHKTPISVSKHTQAKMDRTHHSERWDGVDLALQSGLLTESGRDRGRLQQFGVGRGHGRRVAGPKAQVHGHQEHGMHQQEQADTSDRQIPPRPAHPRVCDHQRAQTSPHAKCERICTHTVCRCLACGGDAVSGSQVLIGLGPREARRSFPSHSDVGLRPVRRPRSTFASAFVSIERTLPNQKRALLRWRRPSLTSPFLLLRCLIWPSNHWTVHAMWYPLLNRTATTSQRRKVRAALRCAEGGHH
jgi:hypothetical protein